MKNQKTILLFVVLVLLGTVLALVARAFMNMQGEAVLLGFLLFPLLAYVVISGRNLEIGFGEWKAKLGQAASEAVKPELGPIGPSLADMVEVGQKGINALEKMLQTYELNESKPIVMIIIIGRGDYDRVITLGFIEKLLLQRSFKFVVFLSEDKQSKDKRVLAYMPSWATREILNKPGIGEEFISIINNDDRFREIYSYPNVTKETISVKENNAKALRQMIELNLDALVVVDENSQLKGVVERERLLSRMMLTLVE